MIVLMEFIVYLALVLFGATLGSFAGATVWRLRAGQLDADKKNKEPYDHKEYTRLKKLLGKGAMQDRSQCLDCQYQLKWYDLIPIVSWLSLKGRCRNCRKPIGKFELCMELGVAAFFVLSYVLWPVSIVTAPEILHFILWLIAGVIMAIMFAYDLKWYLLPNITSYALAFVGVLIVAIQAYVSQDVLGTIISAAIAVAILSGLYAALYVISKGRWVGFGDVKLGVGLALLLVDWQLALLALVLANFVGCLVVIPGMLSKKLKRNSQVPFGPFLIAGTVLAWLFGWQIIDAYMRFLGA